MRLKTILGFALGPIGVGLVSLISLPIITWFFSIEDIGRIAMLQMVTALATIAATLGLDHAFVREYHDSPNQKALLWNTLAPVLLLLLIVCGLGAVFFASDIAWALFDFRLPVYGHLTLLCIVAAVLTRYCSLILRMQEQGLAYSISQILPKLIFLGLVLFLAYTLKSHHFYELIWVHTLSIVSVAILFAINTQKHWFLAWQEKINTQQIQSALGFGFPLMLGGFAIWGLNSIDRFFLRLYSSMEALGLYSVSLSFANAATIVTSVFTTLWAPSIFKALAQDQNNMAFFYAAKKHMLAAVVIIASLVGSLSFVVPYFLPKQYAAIEFLLPAVFLIPLLYALSEACAIGIQVVKKTHYTMWCAAIGLLISIAANDFLVPLYGPFGAALAALLAYHFFVFSRIAIAKKLWQTFSLTAIFLPLLMVASVAILGLFWHSAWLHLVWLLVLCSALVYFKSSLHALYQLLQRRKSHAS